MEKYCRNQAPTSHSITRVDEQVGLIATANPHINHLLASNQKLTKELQEARIEIEALKLIAGGK